MASARSGKQAKGTSASLERAIARAITRSMLPGEKKLAPEKLAEAAQLLFETASEREQGKANIALHTSSDGHRYLAIAIVNDDMPFLVDSIAATIAGQGLSIDLLVHPVIPIRRGKGGRLSQVLSGTRPGEDRESFVYIETERVDARARRTLGQSIATTLSDVRAAVADWPEMQRQICEDADLVPGEEGAKLLRWLGSGMLTQLGHVVRKRNGRQSGLLGICKSSARKLLADETYRRAFEWFDSRGEEGIARAPLVVKANRLSNVHRRVPLDLFMVPIVKDGTIEALSVHAGIWTSASLHAAPTTVPRLRNQIACTNERLGFAHFSHDGNALSHVVTALPRDLLIGFSDADFERVVTTMMALVQRPRPRLVVVQAGLERHLFAFVWLPRDMLSTDARLQIMALIEGASGGNVLDWGLEAEGGNLALLRFVIDIRQGHGAVDEAALDGALQSMLRGWEDEVENALAQAGETTRAAIHAAHYADAFPPAYRTDYGASEAALDILRLNALHAGELRPALGRDARLYGKPGDPAGQLRLKIYQLGGSMPLSDAVPALENFGFRVLAEIPTALENGGLATIHDFVLELPVGLDAATVLARAGEIEAALCAVLNGDAENDVFNRLTVSTAVSARCANLLRTFYRYLRQTGFNVTIYPVVDALDQAPDVTHGLIALFGARHDPGFKGSRKKAEATAEQNIRDGLAKVVSIGDDRILRRYHAALAAVLRTNQFNIGPGEALAYKIDSSAVPWLPRPVPWREVFVYSRRVEGIHLRAGPVARGGIRWSDRRDDYRTEVLGLMKAQRVKNAVIVPTGAKGGFYPKQLPDPRRDRDAWAAEGQASYEIFIRSLLSITDNLVDGSVVHPEGVVIRDSDDPYFVVAADKGTARFSDVANGIAEAREFWLDDAFASGGSYGYDHKAMGITARGAWLSVQRHFLEMGVDVQKDPITVIGCGDMSGDVFGNGMLLSRAIRLVAAFDHRHIFIDPDPDPAASWKERKRLFELPRSSWEDYDKQLISRGGGVYPRSLKRIPLSARARKLLGVEETELDPDTLISSLLKAQADLLWFGGIGTYVKASHQNNIAVGDPSNDGLRVDAMDIRAKAIGEGANLGCTQAGRIEFALRGNGGAGGRINTDFIDNSAGVDCSDNEVNIKIAFAAAKRAGRLTEKRRNALLVDMTGDVAGIVLEDNRLQALGLSIAEKAGAKASPSYIRLIDKLEEAGDLDRRTEGLAPNEELSRRAADGHGLTRPELAVLLSSSKLAIQDAIEDSALPDDDALLPSLISAFPQTMQAKFRSDILDHRLRRELVATKLANRLVNRMGLIHPFELAEEEGATIDEVAAAFVCTEQLFGLDAIWDRLESAKMPEAARLDLFARAAAASADHMADILRLGHASLKPSAVIADLAPGVSELSAIADDLLPSSARMQSAAMLQALVEEGAPKAEAELVTHLVDLDGAVCLACLSQESRVPVATLTLAFIELGRRLGLDWAQQAASHMNPSDPWERLLVNGLARDLQHMRIDFFRRSMGKRKQPEGLVEQWSATHAVAIEQFQAMITRAQGVMEVTPAMLAQITSQARNLLAR